MILDEREIWGCLARQAGGRGAAPVPAGIGLFLLSASTLAFEINLTRLFSVSQFYHFAFMAVSIALLGFGASGTFLALLPEQQRMPLVQPPAGAGSLLCQHP